LVVWLFNIADKDPAKRSHIYYSSQFTGPEPAFLSYTLPCTIAGSIQQKSE